MCDVETMRNANTLGQMQEAAVAAGVECLHADTYDGTSREFSERWVFDYSPSRCTADGLVREDGTLNYCCGQDPETGSARCAGVCMRGNADTTCEAHNSGNQRLCACQLPPPS